MISIKQKIYKFTILLTSFCLLIGLSTENVQAGIFNSLVTDYMASGTWTTPGGVTTIAIEGWGGGGAGSGAAQTNMGGESGGGGGAYAKINSFSVSANTNYTTVVGDGGTGDTNSGNAGTDSTFNSTTMVADGGAGGQQDSGPDAGPGGAGGTLAGSTGDVEYVGGNGGDGTLGAAGAGGSGGGGSAGAGGAGGNGVVGTSGVGGAGGIAGISNAISMFNSLWNGGAVGGVGTSVAGNGNLGEYPSSGGSGGRITDTTDRSGGSGTNGKIAITYIEPALSGYPQFVSKGKFATSTASSDTVNLPPGYLKNDLIFLVITGRASGTAGSNDTITVPTGWTQRGSRQRFEVGTNDLVMELWYKIATSTNDTNTVSVGTAFSGTERWSLQTFAYRGVNTNTPFAASNVGGTSAAAATFTPTGPTPAPINSNSRSRVISFVLSADNNYLAFDTSRSFMTRTGSNDSSELYGSRSTMGYSLAVADQATTTTSAAIMPIWEEVANGNDGWAYYSEALEPAPQNINLKMWGSAIVKLIGSKIIFKQK